MNEISKETAARLSGKLLLLVTMATPISSHVKDKNSIFTAHDKDMMFLVKANSWYIFSSVYVSIIIIKLFSCMGRTYILKGNLGCPTIGSLRNEDGDADDDGKEQ